ncbi:MAG: RNA methyltransferase [Candidatus Izemoplasmatales bacterium]|nr:RNA methyltransferase [Candidatus Izemoplasmatales bacterium]
MKKEMIESKQNPLVKEAIKLKQKKYRLLNNSFLVEGEHLVKEAYDKGLIDKVFYVDDFKLKDVEAYLVSKEVMEVMTGVLSNQGVLAICKYPENTVDFNRVLLLDNLQDPGNMGTLIRSAVAFGFETIVAENSVDFFNEKVIRATQGAIFKVNLISDNLRDFINQNRQITFYTTDLKSNNRLEDLVLQDKLIGVILGNEGSGVRQDLIDLVGKSFKLEIKNMESLNVGVAGSIIMYEISKRSV